MPAIQGMGNAMTMPRDETRLMTSSRVMLLAIDDFRKM
jgi:hypothetical protein